MSGPATKPRKAPVVTVKVPRATCELFASYATRCPLCRTLVPPLTQHTCESEE